MGAGYWVGEQSEGVTLPCALESTVSELQLNPPRARALSWRR